MSDKTIKHALIYVDSRTNILHAQTNGASKSFSPDSHTTPVNAMLAALLWARNHGVRTFEYHINPKTWIYDGLGELIVFSRGNGFDWDGLEKAMAAQTHWGTFENCPPLVRESITEEMEQLAVNFLRNDGWIIEEYDD